MQHGTQYGKNNLKIATYIQFAKPTDNLYYTNAWTSTCEKSYELSENVMYKNATKPVQAAMII